MRERRSMSAPDSRCNLIDYVWHLPSLLLCRFAESGRLSRLDLCVRILAETSVGRFDIGPDRGIALVTGILKSLVVLVTDPGILHLPGAGQHFRILDPR